eukprot:1162016-Pelagomonas_calceolata.AAC.26
MQDVSNVHGGHNHQYLGVKNGPEVELWAICWRSEARGWRVSPCVSSLMLMAGNQGGQAGGSTCSLPGGGKQKGGVLPGVLCEEQDRRMRGILMDEEGNNQLLSAFFTSRRGMAGGGQDG